MINDLLNNAKELRDKKAAVTVLLFNQGKILGVSRKHDSSDMGLPGGKLEADESLIEAAKREVKEETGLDTFALFPVFWRIDADFYVVTFIGQWKGEISTSEQGRVDWVEWEDLERGTFGKYNSALKHELQKKKMI